MVHAVVKIFIILFSNFFLLYGAEKKSLTIVHATALPPARPQITACARRCVTLALLLAIATSTGAGAQTVAIVGGTVYPVSGPRIERGTVLMRDGRIVAVGANVADFVFDNAVAVPEPVSLSLIAVGGILMLRRRKA